MAKKLTFYTTEVPHRLIGAFLTLGKIVLMICKPQRLKIEKVRDEVLT